MTKSQTYSRTFRSRSGSSNRGRFGCCGGTRGSGGCSSDDHTPAGRVASEARHAFARVAAMTIMTHLETAADVFGSFTFIDI